MRLIESKASVTDLLDLAGSLVTDGTDAITTLQCNACEREVDTYDGAHDDAVAAIRAFLEHTAFEHATRCNVHVREVVRVIRFTD